MSKYTTEIRYICEQKSGLSSSKGLNDINDILDNSWDKIFTKNWPIFDESYRKILCEKILRKFYTREICAETVGLWQLWLDSTMCEIMPTYNRLYESEILSFNPLYNTDYTREYTKEITGNRNSENNQKSENENEKTLLNTTTNVQTVESSTTNTGLFDEQNKFSDTPQGGLNGLESDNYLTDARLISRNTQDTTSGSGKTSNNENIQTNETNNETETVTGNTNSSENSTEKWTERIIGKTSGENYNTLLKEFRENIINIDQMIIRELEPLFFNLW